MTPGAPVPGRRRHLAAALARRARTAPVSVALAAWLVLATVLVHTVLDVAGRRALDQAALLRMGEMLARPWTIPASLLMPAPADGRPVTGGLLLTLVALAALGVPAERRLGSARFVGAVLLGHLVAVPATEVFAAVVAPLFPEWSDTIAGTTFTGPSLGVFAAAAAASAVLPRLWRRRFRLTFVTAVTTMALFHGGAFGVSALAAMAVGLALGRLLPHGAQSRPYGSVHEARLLIALVVAAGAVGPIVGALLGFGDGPLAVLGGFIAYPREAPLPDLDTCAAAGLLRDCMIDRLVLRPSRGLLLLTCVPTALLLVAALGLARGRRAAVALTIGVELVVAGAVTVTFATFLLDSVAQPGAAPFTWLDLTATLLPCLAPLGVIALLLANLRLFTVPGRRHGLTRFVLVSLAAAAAGLAAYVVLGLVVADQWTEPATAALLAADAPRRLVPLEYLMPIGDAFPRLLPVGRGGARTLYAWTGVAVWAVVVAEAVRLMRHGPSADDESPRARALLRRHGGPALAWMGLWEGNRHWFSADGESYVPYRVLGGIAVTTGDPIGPAADRERVVREFLAYAEEHGWVVCFYSASAALREVTDRLGWQAAPVAEEAVIELEGLAFTGKKFQDVRTGLNQVAKGGYTLTWTTWASAPLDVRLQVRALSEQWAAEHALPEMGFTLGGLAELADPDVRLLLLFDADARLHGAASWMPICGPDGAITGWTLDFMRRRPDGFRYTMEALIGRAALDLQEEGYAELSLSGAPLARVDESDATAGFPAVLDKMLETLGQQLEPVYGFRSLLRFKAKFQPTYRPLVLLYPDATALPAIGTAIARAYLPDARLGEWWRVGGRLRAARAEAKGAVKSEAKRAAEAPAEGSS